MADYTYAGVFIEEPQVGVRSIRGVLTAVPAFVGHSKRGPNTDGAPWYVSGWSEFEALFGGLDSSYMLGYAVHAFFSIAGEGQTKAAILRHDLAVMTQGSWEVENSGSSATAFTVYMRSKNEDQNNYYFSIDTGSRVASEIKLTVEELNSGAYSTVEVWDNLSLTTSSTNYILKKVGQVDQYISKNIYIGAGTITTGGFSETPNIAAGFTRSGWSTDGGYSGTAKNLNLTASTSLGGLNGLSDLTILATPDHINYTDQSTAISFVETRADMIYLLDFPSDKTVATAATYVTSNGISSNRAAAYFPQLYINDPSRSEAILIPPCGHVAGVMARTDATRGVWKAPAGVIDGKLNGILGASVDRISNADLTTLYNLNINPIRFRPSKGYCIMGSRILATDPIWWQVPHRRLFDYVEDSIEEGTEWAVFEPNDKTLWDKITLSVTSFLMTKWREGAFYDGGTGDWRKAFFVKCDETTNLESTITAGQVITQVGIAPVRPAEFVVFQVSQWDGGRLVEELGLQGSAFSG